MGHTSGQLVFPTAMHKTENVSCVSFPRFLSKVKLSMGDGDGTDRLSHAVISPIHLDALGPAASAPLTVGFCVESIAWK